MADCGARKSRLGRLKNGDYFMKISALDAWFAFAPLWMIGATIFLGMIITAVIGYSLRQRHAKEGEITGDFQEGFMVSAVMGLLALLVGFTFSLAIDRFDTRRDRVLVEANAIGATYLRTQLLDEPYRARISKLLVDYIDNRVTLGESDPGPQQNIMLAKNDRQIHDLWSATVAAFPSMKGYDFSSSYLETMNLLIDMDAARKVGRTSHVPAAVLVVLFSCQFIAAGVMAYVLVGRRGRQSAALLFLLFGVSLMLVIDIDRPTSGSVTESQEPIIRLQASIHAQPPATFDQFKGQITP